MCKQRGGNECDRGAGRTPSFSSGSREQIDGERQIQRYGRHQTRPVLPGVQRSMADLIGQLVVEHVKYVNDKFATAAKKPIQPSADIADRSGMSDQAAELVKEAAPRAETKSATALLPCLKERAWNIGVSACRPLWEQQASDYMPWLAVGYDSPTSFEFVTTQAVATMNTTREALERQALKNLRQRKVTWEPLDVDVPNGTKFRGLVCHDDFLAAEHILDRTFMLEAQRRLDASRLLVAVPRRGMLLCTNGERDAIREAVFGTVVAEEYARGESAVISPLIFVVQDAAIVGLIETYAETTGSGGAPNGDESDEEAPYFSAMVVKNDRGTEDVKLMVGGDDGERLSHDMQYAFVNLLHEHMPRPEFSGHMTIVVLGYTPVSARPLIEKVIAHLKSYCAELSQGEHTYQVSVEYQKSSWPGADQAPPREHQAPSRPTQARATRRPGPPPQEAPKTSVIVRAGQVLGGAASLYILFELLTGSR